MTVGQTLKTLRDAKGISMSRCAGLADVNKSVVHSAENDKEVTIGTLRKIVCHGLEMPMSAFWRVLERASEAAKPGRRARKENGKPNAGARA